MLDDLRISHFSVGKDTLWVNIASFCLRLVSVLDCFFGAPVDTGKALDAVITPYRLIIYRYIFRVANIGTEPTGSTVVSCREFLCIHGIFLKKEVSDIGFYKGLAANNRIVEIILFGFYGQTYFRKPVFCCI